MISEQVEIHFVDGGNEPLASWLGEHVPLTGDCVMIGDDLRVVTFRRWSTPRKVVLVLGPAFRAAQPAGVVVTAT